MVISSDGIYLIIIIFSPLFCSLCLLTINVEPHSYDVERWISSYSTSVLIVCSIFVVMTQGGHIWG
jgi:hypothetical protein